MDFPKIDFADEEACFQALLRLVHPSGLDCPHCGDRKGIAVHESHRDAWHVCYQCSRCGGFFNAWTKTVLQGTHHPPSEILRIIKGILERESTRHMAQELGCDRGKLARFRAKLQRWVIKTFDRPTSPPKKRREKRMPD